jgi:DNA-binding transcriptional LysR family regulator
MDLASRLLLLLEVHEFGSFTKVSEHRNVNKSVISKQITQLENGLGVRLLNRTTRSLSLTSAGVEMVKQSTSLRQLLNETERLAQNYHSEPRGKLKITSSLFFGRQYVQKAALELQSKYPEVLVELRLEDRVVDMVAEGYDIGVRVGRPKDSTLIAKTLARNRLLIVASQDFLNRYGVPQTIAELERLPAVAYSSTGLLIDKFKYYDEKGVETHLQLNVNYKVNDLEMLTNSVSSGNMFAVITAQMIENEVLDGKLIPIMTHLQLLDWGTFYVVYPHRNCPNKTVLFIDILKNIIGENDPVWEARIPGFDHMYGLKN